MFLRPFGGLFAKSLEPESRCEFVPHGRKPFQRARKTLRQKFSSLRLDWFKRKFRIVPIDVKIQLTNLTAVIVAHYRRGSSARDQKVARRARHHGSRRRRRHVISRRGRPISTVEQVVDIHTQSDTIVGNPCTVAVISASRRMDRKWHCHATKTVAKMCFFKVI
jgi:hypothetical protein